MTQSLFGTFLTTAKRTTNRPITTIATTTSPAASSLEKSHEVHHVSFIERISLNFYSSTLMNFLCVFSTLHSYGVKSSSAEILCLKHTLELEVSKLLEKLHTKGQKRNRDEKKNKKFEKNESLKQTALDYLFNFLSPCTD